ncbi:GNAT family N-acetyltransferase [Pseudomonas sp. S1_E04]
MEYHADRFVDASIMFYEDDTLIAVMPASQKADVLASHGGLTYGGLVLSQKVRAVSTLECFETLKEFSVQHGFEKLIYKAIPYVFARQGAQEDLYALFRVDARLIRRDLSSVIYLKDRLKLSKGRKWLIARAKKNNLSAMPSNDWDGFIGLLSGVLERHDAVPVHTAQELISLQSLFPGQISLMAVEHEGKMLAATLLFKFENVVHTQYLATSEEGKELGALDYLIEFCIQKSQVDEFEYFSFGISTEDQGRYVNPGLLAQKESFGARGMAIDSYEVALK